MSTRWTQELATPSKELPLAGLLEAVVARLGDGATTPDEFEPLRIFAERVATDAPLQDIEFQLRELSYDGYLRGALCTLASTLRRIGSDDRPSAILIISRELIDALAPDLGIALARAVLALPAVEKTQHERAGPYTAANLLLGEALADAGDVHAALRHMEAILAFDVDHPRALRGWAAAVQALERRGVSAEHRSRGLALLDGLEELELAGASGLARYDLGRPLGRGRHAVVYQAWDRRVGRDVAIKRLLARNARTDALPERVLSRRFFAEARTLARVRSPYVVALLDVQPAHRFIALDLCRGGNLRIAMRRGQVGAADLPRVGRQLRAALQAVHAAGAVHRDIKPANILVRDSSPGAPIALADFGLAVHAVPHEGRANAGTLRYLAPELRQGAGQATAASDLFSAGLVLLEVALAPQPLPPLFDRLDGGLDAQSLVPDGLPEGWTDHLATMLSTDPLERAW